MPQQRPGRKHQPAPPYRDSLHGCPTRVCSLALWSCEDPTSWQLVTLGCLLLEFTQSFWLQLGVLPPSRPRGSSGLIPAPGGLSPSLGVTARS